MSDTPAGRDATEDNVAVVKRFLADLRAIFNGVEINPYRTFSDDVEFVSPGRHHCPARGAA